MLDRAIIIKDYRGFIRQGKYYVSSIDIEKIKKELKKAGITAVEMYFDEIINQCEKITDCYIIYSSSQNVEYKSYIEDVLFYLSKHNILIPRFEIFKSHENKGFQELLKKDRNICSLKCLYLAVNEDIEKYKNQIDYPVVLKKVTGSSSKGVYKINCEKELNKQLKKINSKETIIERLKYWLKRYILRRIKRDKYNDDYFKESKSIGRFVLQEYVPSNGEDWKVLIVNNKYYVLNRKAKKDDFRASGSGIRIFNQPPESILNYAKYIYDLLDVPFISLDLCTDGQKEYLIEFQGTHFGMYTLIESKFHYIYDNNQWKKVNAVTDMSVEYGKSIVEYIKKKDLV